MPPKEQELTPLRNAAGMIGDRADAIFLLATTRPAASLRNTVSVS